MIVVDAHEDIAYNVLSFKRDYLLGTAEIRRRDQQTDAVQRNGIAATSLPDALRGRVAIIFATLAAIPPNLNMPWTQGGYVGANMPVKMPYTTPQEAHDIALEQLAYYLDLVRQTSRVSLILNQSDLDSVLQTWTDGADPDQQRQGLVLLMEGADPIIEPKQFGEWYGRGLRMVGPAWSRTRYAGGTSAPGPLTDLGRELLDEMIKYNAILDLSHLAEQSFWEAIERYNGVVICSHSNPRRFQNSDRQLSDAMIKRLAERDGVMGIVMFNKFLNDTWQKGDAKDAVALSTAIDAMDYVCQLTGSTAHVGIGTDFDGGFGAESAPAGLDSVADLWSIGNNLQSRGYSQADIEAVLGGNMLRKLRQALPTL